MNYQRELGFEVWVTERTPDRIDYSQCLAAFYYWQECLDYKDYALSRGVSQVFIRTEFDGRWKTEIRTIDGSVLDVEKKGAA